MEFIEHLVLCGTDHDDAIRLVPLGGAMRRDEKGRVGTSLSQP